VARLVEMRADDVAARRGGGEKGRRTLLTALLAMGADVAVAQPPSWLAATGGVVAARVRRLADPPPRARWMCYGVALTALTLAIAAASALVPVLAVSGLAVAGV
jgi:hypothetical protein